MRGTTFVVSGIANKQRFYVALFYSMDLAGIAVELADAVNFDVRERRRIDESLCCRRQY